MTQPTKTAEPHLRLVSGADDPASDGELCRAFAAGDSAAFGRLVARHQARVLSVVRRYAQSPEEARDLAQRAFLKAFQAARRTLGRLNRGTDFPFQAWLLRIAINLGKNHARQARKWRQAPLTVVESAGNGEASPLESLERSERERMARAAVLELPRRQREVLVLRVDAGLPFAEVAATLGITENNAKVHFHHAAKRLKELIARRMEEGGSDVRLP